MRSSETPGLKTRRNRDGTARLYWAARADLVRAGYRPETVRLFYTLPDDLALVAAACQRYQAELLEWSRGRPAAPTFNGTIRDLSRRYQVDQESPFRRLKHSTRTKDTYTLKIIETAFGDRALAALGLPDFRRWFDAARKPKAPGGPERLRKAHGIIKKLRELIAYGIAAELPECPRLGAILAVTRFEAPAPRTVTLDATHVQAFVSKAIDAGRLSLALATVIQFETMLRQRDVIGEWEPIPEGEPPTGIVLNGRRWVNGLTWADLSGGDVFRKRTTKTGRIAAHDVSLLPLVRDLLDRVAPERRVGPLIVDEIAGRPYAECAFSRAWRPLARAAGIPDEVQNRDARAGGITEAEDAGVHLDTVRAAAAHTQASTTARYSRGAVGKSRETARARAAHRAKNAIRT